MPSKVEKFKRKTEPKDVAKTYEASRSLQLESMSEILPNQSRLYNDVKAKCESLGIKPMLISLYYAFACELAKKMAKFKGKTLMQEATALQIKYINKGLDSKVLSLIAHNMGVALDPSIEVHVINFPSEYPLPSGQVSDLKNVNVISLPSLPPGTNTIGNVNAIKSGTWNIDNLLNPHPVQLTPEDKLLDANQYSGTFSPSAAGSTTIISAVIGKVIRIYDFYLWNSGTADVGVRLYFGTSGKNLFKGKLSPKTGVMKTFVRPWESRASDSLVLYLDAAGTCDYGVGGVQV